MLSYAVCAKNGVTRQFRRQKSLRTEKVTSLAWDVAILRSAVLRCRDLEGGDALFQRGDGIVHVAFVLEDGWAGEVGIAQDLKEAGQIPVALATDFVLVVEGELRLKA